MKAISSLIYFALLSLIVAGCHDNGKLADAYGNFEAVDVTVSAQAGGQLVLFEVKEGRPLKQGQLVGLVDTQQLHLQQMQIKSSMRALGKRVQDPSPQIDVLIAQRKTLEREKKRFEALVADKAATPKQLDDISSQLTVVNKQIEAAGRQAQIANRGILSETDPMQAQLNVLREQLRKCYIYNPIDGVVLTKIAEPQEIVGFGTPLYRIANLDTLVLRAYISGDQLGLVKTGRQVTVKVDAGEGKLKSYTGAFTFISDQSEFTPKTIQTRDERVNLVYAAKIAVANDGFLKIGMPAEVYFPQAQAQKK
ncbi:MAG: HlyD family efflux transporter periplasmic adaptor subunit [Saprospiraceae bacterium]|nr:HlyD family efflux transporter periplasmic adaptor subunit [Saprospiraceae bacterium]